MNLRFSLAALLLAVAGFAHPADVPYDLGMFTSLLFWTTVVKVHDYFNHNPSAKSDRLLGPYVSKREMSAHWQGRTGSPVRCPHGTIWRSIATRSPSTSTLRLTRACPTAVRRWAWACRAVATWSRSRPSTSTAARRATVGACRRSWCVPASRSSCRTGIPHLRL